MPEKEAGVYGDRAFTQMVSATSTWYLLKMQDDPTIQFTRS